MPALPLRILYVEDHLSTNEILTRMLRKKGYNVNSVTTAEMAMKVAGEGQDFDLLISDIGLPDSDGWDLLVKLRAKQPKLRAIALTGFGFDYDAKRSSAAGFEIHLTKPVDWPAFEKTVVKLFPEVIGEQ
jgi:CheY-like chemotaxis protein